MEKLSINDLNKRSTEDSLKNARTTTVTYDNTHLEFKKVLYRFLKEFGQNPVTFEHKLKTGQYKIHLSKNSVLLTLEKDNKFDKFEYIFSSSLLRRNKIDQDNDQFIKFIQLVRKIIIDVLKNDVKYY
jgi:hypothetical protein